jgi:hypothetical protein
MQEMLFQRSKFKKFPGGHAPRPPLVSAVLGSHLRRLDNILGEGKERMGPFAVLPHH